MHTVRLPGDQRMTVELAISIGGLLVLLVCSASCKIKDYLHCLVNIVGGKEDSSKAILLLRGVVGIIFLL